MQAEEILRQAKSGDELPHGWIIFPLLRNKVILAIAGWVLGIVIGLGLFAMVASVVIPYNYQHGFPLALLATLLLGLFLFVGLGSLWALVMDARRLVRPDKYIMVLTPEDFVKQEGDKIIHVPCINIRHVTARGTPPPDRSVPSENPVRQVPTMGENVAGFFVGRGLAGSRSGSRTRRRGQRTPTTLAFVDTRTDQEIIVANDNAFGDTFAIAALLKQYAADVQQIFR
ncbi:MAG TPA: hypothetical protein VGU68_16420 [Ktedonobacteraceae bacterium]|nr:hypothetical protein [Ktedonobacteraceae bacterium]